MPWISPENFRQNGPAIWEELIHIQQNSPPLCKPLPEHSALITLTYIAYIDN